MLRAWRPSVCLSVRLSVTLVDCDRTLQQKVENGTWQDKWVGRCLGYLHVEADPDRIILWSRILPRNARRHEKNVELCNNCSHVSLSQHMLSLLFFFSARVFEVLGLFSFVSKKPSGISAVSPRGLHPVFSTSFHPFILRHSPRFFRCYVMNYYLRNTLRPPRRFFSAFVEAPS